MGWRHIGTAPSKKARRRLKERVRVLLQPGNHEPWEEVVTSQNRTLRGWANYFSHGTVSKVRRWRDRYVYHRVHHFFRRRQNPPAQATARFPAQRVFGELGVLSVGRLPRVRGANALA